ncbi:cobalamin-binding protein [Pseudoalteromonas sp. MMG013]|uniref:cobalamin-binding protein n=1 Tax=Pseudoalteromonas sp. MMG013 TaxID=2822687 RepID=UPI001B379487|nr:cobalamin-binding protein [Pseudoalteromonas sp. MMG013]MBQ4861146.1 cobalamin-binding protein [Pseudoalteromonas sp. MMG013]
MQRYSLLLLMLLLISLNSQAAEAKRIVALAPHIVENLFTVGAGDLIVGTVDYADFPAQANQIPRIGGYNGIQLEKLLALKPDLVIAWQTGSKKIDLEKVEKLGIKVVYSEAKDINKVADELRLFGQLTGNVQQAEGAAGAFTAQFNAIKGRYADTPSLKVFYQLWPEPMMTVNKNTWIHQLLMVCGVENAFANNATDYPQISIENVIKASPQVIIVPDEKTKKQVKMVDWHKWPEIPAVKYDQFITVNADLLHRYSTRVLDGVTDMCDKILASKAFYQAQVK